MTNKQFFYGRVSTREQNEERQLQAAREFGIEERDIYIDKMSGKDFNREQYQILKGQLRHSDLLVISSIDRLGRNYNMILSEWRSLIDLGVDIVVLDMPLLDTRHEKNLMGTFISDIVLQLLSFVAENERINIRQRQAEGIAAAKKRGVRFGRPIKEMPDHFDEIIRQWNRKEITIPEICEQYHMSESTFYRKMREYKAEHKHRKA